MLPRAGISDSGRRTINSLPRSLPSLRPSTLPPCICRRRATRLSPIPRPSCVPTPLRRSWANISNKRGSMAGKMPIPLSRTDTTASWSSWRAVNQICPPCLVYRAALLSRLVNTCSRRTASAWTIKGASGINTLNLCPFSLISDMLASTALRNTTARSIGTCRNSIFPLVMRDISSRSSTRRTIYSTCRFMTGSTRGMAVAPSGRAMSASALEIGASGLRSSCASVARNSSFRRSASSRAVSALTASVTSIDMPTCPAYSSSALNHGSA